MKKHSERRSWLIARRRIAGIYTFIVLGSALLILRLGYLQIAMASQFTSDVKSQNFDAITIPAPRGQILDRQGAVLATNQPVFRIIYIRYPNDNAKIASVAKRLAYPLGQSEAALIKEMTQANAWNAYATLVRQATPLEISYVEEHKQSLPGIEIIQTPERAYPMGSFAAHVIGYTGAIPANQAQAYQAQGYTPSAQVGLSGLEQQYESVLRGQDGVKRIPVNPAGVPLPGGTISQAPKTGDNLVLNLDGPLEKVAEQALVSRIAYLRGLGEKNVHSGAIVVMNVHTGAVLAMASYPTYNPNWWIGGISSAHYQSYLNGNAGFNRAISGLYMPGSTQKMLTALVALQNHSISPNLIVNDTGGLQIGTYYMRSWNQAGFGPIGLDEALEVSDDTYFYQVGLDMGHYNVNNPPANINAWLNGPRVAALRSIDTMGKQFGLTSPTGVDLPGEATGYVTYANPPTLYDLPAAAIGQEESYSPIGLATYIAAIANGGYRLQPEIVHEITSPTGRVLKVIKPHVIDKVKVNPAYLKIIQKGLEMATHGTLGTATYFFGSDPVNVAGKTGTAESGIPGRNNSVFVGYAPYNNPQIAIAAVIPNVTGEGFRAAAPMSQQVIDAYFKQMAKK
ncbi:peptidoglycan D,D-transpeptidase FtsI family protein [Ferroacidibacillus organovorans]|uniref:Penicillin-binding protein 2 n=1 Tax=Ferroacidibacillus organovorans TaxID=1765683 RepID=A0A101XNP9_9BACL|nr:penicillin-binding transpeptidase domain-containing protein [Ferroacidibacillus organovorans]KUO94659.1 hypothetical protein ATW55_01980 [Ferroacidibacillus organovorans]